MNNFFNSDHNLQQVDVSDLTITGTTGDILYMSSSSAQSHLPIGSTGQALTVVSGLPAWAAIVNSIVAGTAISISGATGAVTINNAGVTSAVAGTAISVSGATGAVTFNNTGVTSNVAGTGISVSGATGAVTVTNAGVTSNVAGTDISVSGATGAVTINDTSTLATVTGRGATTATVLTLTNTTEATSSTVGGSATLSGGLAVAKTVYANNLHSVGSATVGGAATIAGLISVAGVGGISAAGTTQGTATALTASVNHITTCASGAGVVLPTPSAGTICTIINSGANALLVYPPSTGAIDNAGTNNAISVPVNSVWTGQTISSGASSTWWSIDPNVIGGTNISTTYGNGSTTIAVTGTVASATSATTATNIAGGASGTIFYQTAAGITAALAIGSSGYALQVVSGLPSWQPVSATTATSLVNNLDSGGTLNTGTTNIDWSAGDFVKFTMGSSTATFTYSNTPASGKVQTITILLLQPGAGGPYTLPTFPTIKWDSGATPVLATGANKTDIIQVTAVNDSGTTTYYGAQIFGNG